MIQIFGVNCQTCHNLIIALQMDSSEEGGRMSDTSRFIFYLPIGRRPTLAKGLLPKRYDGRLT